MVLVAAARRLDRIIVACQCCRVRTFPLCSDDVITDQSSSPHMPAHRRTLHDPPDTLNSVTSFIFCGKEVVSLATSTIVTTRRTKRISRQAKLPATSSHINLLQALIDVCFS